MWHLWAAEHIVIFFNSIFTSTIPFEFERQKSEHHFFQTSEAPHTASWHTQTLTSGNFHFVSKCLLCKTHSFKFYRDAVPKNNFFLYPNNPFITGWRSDSTSVCCSQQRSSLGPHFLHIVQTSSLIDTYNPEENLLTILMMRNAKLSHLVI